MTEKNIGILDPEGINVNPLTLMPYTDEYKKLAKKWSKFPAYKRSHDILKSLRENQVTLIISGTGSGKTVLLPKFVLHIFDYNPEKKIAVTLPKQIIAKSAAEFAAKTLDVELGAEVGYQYKGSESGGKSSKTQLLYATDGTIVARLLNDPLLSDFDCVIIDEAHERKVQIDFLLYLLRNTLRNRPDFKLVIMSATINQDIFSNYFSQEKFELIDVGGETNYPIESIFLEKSLDENENSKEYLDVAYNTMKKIITNKLPGDILVFITSVSEAQNMCQRLSLDKEIPNDNFCIEVFAGINNEKQELAQDKNLYKEKFGKSRKIVFATNVAESSLTIDGIKYVIDCGLELFSYFDPSGSKKVLKRQLITHAQARQRMGRAGRTEPGICYHLYTKDDFEKNMKRYPEPTIRVSDITGEALRLLNIDNINNFNNLISILSNFIEPPRENYIRYAYNKLLSLNLIDRETSVITSLGKLVSDINLDPEMALCCVAAKRLRCLNEVMSVICVIDACKGNFGELFMLPESIIPDIPENKQKLEQMTKKFNSMKKEHDTKYGDITSILKIFTKMYEFYKTKEVIRFSDYAYKYFLKLGTWEKAIKYYQKSVYSVRQKLTDSNIIKEIPEMFDINIGLRVMASFEFGLRNNIAHLRGDFYVANDEKGIKINKHSYLAKENPHSVIYYEYADTFDKREINIVSKITDTVEKIKEILYK